MTRRPSLVRMPPVIAFASILLLLGAPAAGAAPAAELWERWERHEPASTRRVDHAAWDAFLGHYVAPDASGLNRVAYARVSASDRAALGAYLKALSETPVGTLSRDEQRAFWINLYNALTVKVVLDHYPVDSIRDIDISPGFFSDGPWGQKLIRVEAEPVSLDDIEHRILRPIWRDPRLHYAVNCASVGCPNLMRKAFTAENSDALLTQAAVDYVNDPRGVAVDGDSLSVSRIYRWFRADFGGDEAGVLRHLRRYARPALKGRLEKARIHDYHYDWSLNRAN